MAWGAISWNDLGPLVVVREKDRGEHYYKILAHHLQSILNIVFLSDGGERPLFQEDDTQGTAFTHG